MKSTNLYGHHAQMTLDYIHKAGIQTTPKLERELEQGAKAEKHGFKLQQHAEKSKTIR